MDRLSYTSLARAGVASATLVAMGLFASSSVSASGQGVTIVGTCPGQDWRLSERVKPLPGTGLFTMGAASKHDVVVHRGHTLTWAELNPAEGVHDWSRLDKMLAQAERDDHGVILRLKSSVVDRKAPWGDVAAVPGWVLEKYDPPRVRTRDRGKKEYIEIVVPWDEGVQAAYLDFVRSFGEQGFHRHRRLLGLYVHGISSSWGEEFWLNEAAVAALRPHGLSPEVLRKTFAARISAWASAFGDHADRLAWVGTGWVAAGKDWRAYRQMGDELDAQALELGLGQRWGHSEAYNGRLDQSGQSLRADGTLVTDELDPLIAEARYFGGESEIWRGIGNEAFDYRRAMLRALQMQMRLMWVNDAGVSLDPEIARYFTQVAGVRSGESPDAWSLLRETEVRVGSKKRRVGNLERWLHQTSVAGASAGVRARPVERAKQSKDWGRPIEWAARATGRDQAGTEFSFELDKRFMRARPSADVEIQVSWFDDGASWRLETGSVRGRARSATISGSGQGGEKTTHLRVPVFAPSEAGPDVSLVAETGELTVSRIRIVRADLTGPAGSQCESLRREGPKDG